MTIWHDNAKALNSLASYYERQAEEQNGEHREASKKKAQWHRDRAAEHEDRGDLLEATIEEMKWEGFDGHD